MNVFWRQIDQATLEEKLARLTEGSGNKVLAIEEYHHMQIQLKQYAEPCIDYQTKMMQYANEFESARVEIAQLRGNQKPKSSTEDIINGKDSGELCQR